MLSICNFYVALFKLSHSQDFERIFMKLNSDHEVKITRNETRPRLIAESTMVSMWSSYVTSFSSYRIHKLRCSRCPPTHLLTCHADNNSPLSLLRLRGKNPHITTRIHINITSTDRNISFWNTASASKCLNIWTQIHKDQPTFACVWSELYPQMQVETWDRGLELK